MNSKTDDLSVLIPSCDAYSDLGHPFFALFWKYWPDCPYPVYLGANHQSFTYPSVKVILVGEDQSWAESTRKMVEHIDTPFIMILLEDFLLCKPVDTDQVQRCFNILQKLEGGYLRLTPLPPPDIRLNRISEIGEIEKGAPYRVGWGVAIWRKDILLGLLVDGESPWDMEIKGSRRSDLLDAGFYCTWNTALIITMV